MSESSPSSSTPKPGEKEESESKQEFAFCNHSQKTLPQNLPPAIDNKVPVKQKRRRTSPEDHAVLEAEYQKNPKPDKAARLDIVDRVALGEKEVQIWFQNRRQNDRRKLRPLLPHELKAFCSSISPYRPANTYGAEDCSDTTKISNSVANVVNTNASNAYQDASSASGVPVPTRHVSDENLKDSQPNSSPANFSSPFSSFSQGSTNEVGYFSNRRNAVGTIQRSFSYCCPQPPHSTLFPPHRPTSRVRLSMSLDGAAKVTTSSDSSPSPPRKLPSMLSVDAVAMPRPFGPLQRSHSMLTPSELTRRTSQSLAVPHTPIQNKTWSWSPYANDDGDEPIDARDALSAQQLHSTPGSAVGELIRTHSAKAKRVLSPNPNKRNAQPLQRQDFSAKRRRPLPTVAKAHSDSALESPSKVDRRKKKAKGSDSYGFNLYSSDSDKENWEPGTRTRPRRRPHHPNPSTTGDGSPILRENVSIPSQCLSLEAYLEAHVSKTRGQHAKNQIRNLEAASERAVSSGDEEVATFMGEEKRNHDEKEREEREEPEQGPEQEPEQGPEKKEEIRESDDAELDCVQGLLSLSQGAWC